MEQWRFNRLKIKKKKKRERKLQERIGEKKDNQTKLIYENTKKKTNKKQVNKCYKTMWPPFVIKEDLQTTQPNKSLSGDKESWRGGGWKMNRNIKTRRANIHSLR